MSPGGEVLAQLALVPLFSGLPEADVRALVAGSEVVVRPNGFALWEEGDAVERFFVLIDGHVELSVAGEGRRSVVEVAGRGTVLGEAALFGGGRFLMSARVVGEATLLAIPAHELRARLEERFDLLLHILSVMSFRLRLLVRQIAELKLKNTAQRLGLFVLSLAEAGQGAGVVRFPYDKRMVAEELGMKPESLSRALAKLARIGVESRPDNSVAIADIEALRDFCIADELG